jgi:4-hydroxythreonine-4-phosphate dehydrogenase
MFCLMLADDFTGACDTSLQFSRAGLQSIVALNNVLPEGADVVALDTETRNENRSGARDKLLKVCDAVSEWEYSLLYKKVDSALRGNLGIELRTIMESLDVDLCLMAPAFPQAGRVTVGGYHLVHGIPVDRTEVGNDPGASVRGSFLPHLLDSDGSFSIRNIGLEDISQGPDHILAMIEGLRKPGHTVIVLDAASNSDLRNIALAAARMSVLPLMCGSAGLAAHIPDAFGVRVGGKVEQPRVAGPVLVVVGSAESVTRAQVGELRTASRIPEWEIHLEANLAGSDVAAALVSELRNRGKAILSLVGLHAGVQRSKVVSAIASLGQIAKLVVDAVPTCGLVATGAWTAVEVLKALGGTGARIEGEVVDGVPACSILGGPHEGVRMVTKGGAIGEPDVLVGAVSWMSDKDSVEEGERPLLAITMGDACGIGPEVIVKALSHPEVYRICRPFVIGHPELLRDSLKLADVQMSIREVSAPQEVKSEWGTIEVMSPVALDVTKIIQGEVCSEAGRGAVEWVITGVDLAVADRIDGIVTAPLNKEAMNLAGFKYAGHTELLGERTGGHDVRLMLASERMNVVHVTGHVAIADVPGRLTEDGVFDTIVLFDRALKDMGRTTQRIAVCGLNPHAGEAGLFGNEDTQVIKPAIDRAITKGIEAIGPLPADTVFFKAYDGIFDGVVAMYHDQGHAPAKLVAFDTAVNVTLGLPIVRVSVDHGTAFDIVGKGLADETNMLHTLRLGAKLANGRRANKRK